MPSITPMDYLSWLEGEGVGLSSTTTSRLPEDVRCFSTDSRSIKPGEWFVPLVGESFDGHSYINQAMAKGASGFFYQVVKEKQLDPQLLSKGICVYNPLSAFQAITKGWRKSLDGIKVIALTGSVGKTTCKEMLATMFAHAGPSAATKGSYNNEIGVPKTLQTLNHSHQFAVLELAARHENDIRLLTELSYPDIVGVLNVGLAHIGEFGSEEVILRTKTEIYRHSPPHATQVVFADDQRLTNAAKATKKNIITFSEHHAADVKVKSVGWAANGSQDITISTGHAELLIQMKIGHASYPILSAACVAFGLAAGLDHQTIEQGLSQFNGAHRRFQVHESDGVMIIDDAYNANPQSMKAGLTTLRQLFPTQRIMVVLGDMLELGESAIEQHRLIGEFCAAGVRPECLATIGALSLHLAAAAKDSASPPAKVVSFQVVDEAIDYIVGQSRNFDAVYLKASNGIKLQKLLDALLTPSNH